MPNNSDFINVNFGVGSRRPKIDIIYLSGSKIFISGKYDIDVNLSEI
jgi:hypothetical protein